MRSSLVKAILDYFNILSLVGISTAMGILWRRMNTTGMFCSTIVAVTVFLLTRHIISWSEANLVEQGILVVTDGVRTWTADGGILKLLTESGLLGWTKTDDGMKLAFTRLTTIAAPLLVGVISGVTGSLLTKPPKSDMIEKFFTKIYIPIGQEDKLTLPLDEAIPQEKRLFTSGGLFLVKPSRQSLIGLVVTLGICLACVLVMLLILK
jgi:Na+/proline symporter